MLKTELYKIFKRKESVLLLLMSLVPVLYGWGFSSGSSGFIYSGSGKVACVDWLQIMSNMVYQIAIFHIFLSIISVRSLGSEIEDSSIQLYLYRFNNRNKMFYSKALSLYIYSTICFLIFICVSVFVYYFMMTNVPSVASGVFFSDRKNAAFYICISTYTSYILVIAISLLLSVIVKPLIAIAMSVLIHIISLFACQIKMVCYFIPLFYSNRLQDIVFGEVGEKIGNSELYFFTDDIRILFLFNFGLSMLYIIVFMIIGVRWFNYRDLD